PGRGSGITTMLSPGNVKTATAPGHTQGEQIKKRGEHQAAPPTRRWRRYAGWPSPKIAHYKLARTRPPARHDRLALADPPEPRCRRARRLRDLRLARAP